MTLSGSPAVLVEIETPCRYFDCTRLESLPEAGSSFILLTTLIGSSIAGFYDGSERSSKLRQSLNRRSYGCHLARICRSTQRSGSQTSARSVPHYGFSG